MYNVDLLNNVELNVKYRIVDFDNEEILFNEGDTLTDIGIILKGSVTISTITLDGFSFEISKIVKGDVFGNALALIDNPILKGTVKVNQNTKILFIKITDFKFLLLNNQTFLINYLKYEAYKNMYLQYKVKLLGQPSIREKILFYLKEEIKKTGSNIVYLNMSKEKLSNILSVNRPSLSRELIRMKEDGLITYDKYKIKCLFN